MQHTIFDLELNHLDEHCLFLASDIHFDCAESDRDMLKADLDYAMKVNADILINGDLFDLILFGDKKRGHVSNMPNWYDAQIDNIVDWAIDFLRPYAKNIRAIGVGNHEVSAVKYSGTDCVNRVIHALEREEGANIAHLGYTGFITYRIKIRQGSLLYNIFYNHGRGGGGKGKGVTQHIDVASTHVAHLYWLAHNHAHLAEFDLPCVEVSSKCKIRTFKRMVARTGGYQRNDKHENKEYKKRGYTIDWSGENFLRKTGKGSQIVTLRPNRITEKTKGVVVKDETFIETKLESIFS